jgi:uncharacterized membrane protein
MSEEAKEAGEIGILSTGRIEALTDGVFAIVMTLLVLELAIEGAPANDEELLHELAGMWNEIYGYIMTFIALAVFWIIHRLQFNYIVHSDGVTMWLNIFFLTTVALYPFMNNLLGYEGAVPVIIYSFNSIISLLILFVFWWYASSNNRLLKYGTDPRIIKLIKYLPVPGIIGLVIGVPLAYFSALAITILFISLLAFYIIFTAYASHRIQAIEVESAGVGETSSDF